MGSQPNPLRMCSSSIRKKNWKKKIFWNFAIFFEKPCFLRKWRQILRKTCTYRILKNWKIVYLTQFSKWAQILWSHWRKTQFQYIKNRIFLIFFRFCAILGLFTVILKQSGDLVKISKKKKKKMKKIDFSSWPFWVVQGHFSDGFARWGVRILALRHRLLLASAKEGVWNHGR